MPEIRELITSLKPDPWREQAGFTAEVAAANELLFDPAATRDATADVLNAWIHRHQPCLFGRMAAKVGLLSYCILTEADLSRPDEEIGRLIQDARTAWTREGFRGRKSAFVILAISRRLAFAIPDENVKELALRLASLYLLTDVTPDHIFHDRIFLEIPGQNQTAWEWHAGVNYFSAQADKRWWQDHRIPGGMAFSVNSVGHMVKSGLMARAFADFTKTMGAPDEEHTQHKLFAQGTAIELAMRTIGNASEAVSGKATKLLDLPLNDNGQPASRCPVELSDDLRKRDFSQYLGHYHTDFTVPSEYFRPEVERPAELQPHVLDFTYLYKEGPDNPDHETMFRGRQIRADEGLAEQSAILGRERRMFGRETAIAENDRLQRALA